MKQRTEETRSDNASTSPTFDYQDETGKAMDESSERGLAMRIVLNPLLTLGVGIGIGFVAGRMLTSR